MRWLAKTAGIAKVAGFAVQFESLPHAIYKELAANILNIALICVTINTATKFN
ncbi:MAG: hypothetical protein V7L00_22685 [Nostoc sp.]|uniref:hypothetical protein n=1 Tax=unclassified Nostoc TaxID=2593658 RepID=UPI0025E98861|nr:hypothetical protein [Nostoc sp. JL33]MBN3869139.1 hypothetical protein [Nostoc sp. JL33]